MNIFENSNPVFPFPLERRKALSQRLINSNIDMIPIIVIFDEKIISKFPNIKHQKILLYKTSPLGSILPYIRTNFEKNTISSESIFLMCKKRSLILSDTAFEVYSKYADPDGFLYITCFLENVFG